MFGCFDSIFVWFFFPVPGFGVPVEDEIKIEVDMPAYAAGVGSGPRTDQGGFL